MQQISETRQANLHKLSQMSDARALERLAKHPQTATPSPGPAVAIAKRVTGGGDAGLARLVGQGKKMHKEEKMESDDEMEMLEGGARHQGKALLKHLAALHGGAYAKEFIEGMMDDEEREEKPKAARKVRGGAGMFAVSEAPKGVPGLPAGGATVAPGAMAPTAAGAVPFAPASFKRNTVGMGKSKMAAVAVAHSMPAEVAAMKGGKRSERGQKIAKLMREHKMSLAEASKYLKEHPM